MIKEQEDDVRIPTLLGEPIDTPAVSLASLISLHGEKQFLYTIIHLHRYYIYSLIVSYINSVVTNVCCLAFLEADLNRPLHIETSCG